MSDPDHPHTDPVWLISGYTPAGDLESVEVHSAPPVSSITLDMLAQLDPQWRDPDDAEVLVLAPDVRYRIGRLINGRTARLLTRIDDAIARLDTGRTEAGELPLPRCEWRELHPGPTPAESAVEAAVAHVVSTRSAAPIVPPGHRPRGGPLYRNRPAAAAAE